jgi:hypothetical protein
VVSALILKAGWIAVPFLAATCATRNDTELERRILAACAADTVIHLDRIVPERWDRVCVVRPYTLARDAEQAAGIRWRGFKRSGMEWRDDANHLVFLDRKKVVRSSVISRRAEFDLPETTCIPAESAYFSVTPRSSPEMGYYRLTPAPD